MHVLSRHTCFGMCSGICNNVVSSLLNVKSYFYNFRVIFIHFSEGVNSLMNALALTDDAPELALSWSCLFLLCLFP